MKKNFFNKLIFLIFISCMFFSNCSFSGDDDNTVQKAALLLSMNNNAVSPDKVRVNLNFETPRGGTILSTQELRDLIFSGAREGGGICNVTGSTKNELCSKEIWLQTGSWSFELEGTIDGVTFKDSVSMNISQINTTIEFNLRPYDGNEAISKGGLYFVLNFSGDADYALLNIKDAVTGTVIETDKKIKGFDVVKKIEYSKTFKGQDSEGLTPGTYKLTVDFYRNDMNTDEPPLNTWEAYARIKAGLTARKEISDFDLTDSYRITYHVPSGATISAAGVVVLCYSRKSDTITLPVYTNAGFKVLSWYETENFNISQPGVTSFNPKTKLKNMDFYPLWDTDTGYVTAGGTGNGLSAESAASSAATALTNLKKLHEYGSEQTNLKIQIDGEVSGNTTIDTDYNYVDSITLKGKTGNSTDSLKGSGSNSVLKLECEKSVTITNLKITGGSGVSYGGGIYVGGKSSVILEDGALIDGNSAVQRGGGIYVSANTGTEGRISLTINDGAKITGNKIVNDGTGEYGGMGIFAESAKIVMNGGEISQNNGQQLNQRGAVRLHTNCVFDLNGGKITNNSVMHIGGNIFCRKSTINMTAGEISEGKAGNESQHGAGGGLWIEKESPFNMSGGIICNNSVSQRSGSTGGAINLRNDGAKLCISGSAYIPSSGTAFDNDIYIQNKEDDTYPAIEISGELTPPSEYVAAGKKIAVSPAGWNRRKVILKAADDAPTGLNIEDYKNYFCFTSNGVNFSYGTDNTAIIMAPYFVASSGTDDDDTPGDSDNPYRTLKYAVGKLSGNYDETIKVKGILKGASEIPDTFSTTNCKSLTIEGASNLDSDGNPQDVLTIADDAASGSVLKINTEVPVTLKNIKITGGKGTPDSDNEVNTFGGGIYFEKGSLTLADGVLITGNSATVSGGGIYMPLRDAKLFMCGTSYVGDKRTTTATGTTADTAGNTCANFAGNSGGGIFNCGNVYLGYSGKDSNGNLVSADWTGGICGNAATQGGGIVSGRDTAQQPYVAGLVKMRTGKISYNLAYEGINPGYGGGISAYDGTAVEILGGEIANNQGKNGGGIHCRDTNSKVSLSGGKILQNSATEKGGAIDYSAGVIEVSGSVYIPCTVEKQNDVYLAENKFLTIAGNLTLPEDAPSNAKNMVITPAEWTRGNQVLGASTAGLIESNKDRFATIDEDFIINQKSGELTKGVLAAPIYVASDDVYDDTRYRNKGSSSGARGTREKPYSSLSTALSEVDASNYTIYIDGTLKGKVEIKEDGSSPINSDILTLRGYIPDGQTVAKAALDGNFSSMGDGNTTLVITAGKTVNIYDLKITGGKNSYRSDSNPCGGGIMINNTGAQVNLESGTVITGNRARNGGGVTVWNGKLTVKDGAVISNNTAEKDSSYGGKGGGIYVENGSVELAGGTIGGSSSEEGNSAYQGGGIYVSYTGDTSEAFTMTGGRVSYNNRDGGTGVHGGAGLYLWRKSTISGGKIDHNDAATDSEGGGIYVDAVCTISGDVEISDNRANKGAGIYTNKDDLTVEGGVFKNNIAGVLGGAIYVWNDFNLKGNPVFTLPEDGVGQGKNDIYLNQGEINITGSVTTSGSYIASVTPSHYSRGERILSSSTTQNKNIMDSLKSKFILTQDNDDWNRKNSEYVSSSETKYFIIIDSPIYVVGNGHDSYFKDAPASGAIGTKSKPYASIFDAQAVMSDSNMDYELVVDGSVTGSQKLSYADKNFNAKSVTIKGYKPTDTYSVTATLNGNSTTGSALTVAAKTADFPVIIQDLTITGGSATDGGGINISKGTVKLTDGTKITGNTATNGGGVYVGSDGTLFMYGKALIGDSATSITRASSSGASYYANKATNGAGIYNNGGAVYIGCDTSGQAASGYTLVNNATDGYYGVRRNYSVSDGAGIYHAAGTLKIASGDISHNNASGSYFGGAIYSAADVTIGGGSFTNNYAKSGGALYIVAGNIVTVNGNAVFTKNEAYMNGGAVYNAGEFIMSSGTIGGSAAADANILNSTYGNFGGAIYQGGTFKISGSAYIPYGGSEKKNDVYLATDNNITVASSTLSGGTKIATIVPSGWVRGKQVLAADGTNVTSITSAIAGKFAVADTEWSVINHSNVGKINADIWVAGDGYASGVCSVKTANDSNRGTKSQPYATIKAAAQKCWTTDNEFIINISGMITGATQEIPAATTTTTLAKKITLTGLDGNAKDGIDRGLASGSAVSGGSALIINYQGYTDITNLKIMGGNTTGNGGGIQINGPSTFSITACPRVNIKTGVLVQQNQAVYGGGIYSSKSILCLSGTATVGNAGASDRSAAGTAISNNINIATSAGGGIYSANGYLYLGGAWANGTINTSGYSLTKGVYANVCTLSTGTDATKNSAAGGIYNYGLFYMMSGNVSYNYGVNTGGVYSMTGSSTIFGMQGGKIHKNAGSGVYNAAGGHFCMSGDACIGDKDTNSVASSATDCSNSKSGLVNAGTAWLGYNSYSASSKSKLTGGIYRNYLGLNAQNDGGAGIKNTGTLYFDSGTIAYNYLYNGQSSGTGGGGIFSSSTVYMTGASGQYACITNNKSSEAGGGLCLNGTSAKLLMSGYALIGKSGQTAPPSASTTDGVNTAKTGGGIAAFNGATVCLGYSAFTSADSNTTASLDNGGVYFNYATSNGGGIYCQGSSGKTINVYIASGKINANKAYYSNGGTNYGHGGGIWANTYCDIYMGGGQISKNSAQNYGGGVYATGRLFMYGTALIGDKGTTVATSSSYGNTAATGGGVYVEGANAGLYMGSDGENSYGLSGAELDTSYGILHNYASGAASDITSTTPTGFGGGVYFEGDTCYIEGGTIGYNLAKKGGGVTIKFSYNMSSGYWGGLYNGGYVTGNRAIKGAGMYIYKNQLNGSDIRPFPVNGVINSNDALSDTGDGGGIYCHWSNVEISGTNAKVNSNKAYNGGGVYLLEEGSEINGEYGIVVLQGGAEISSNEASYYGGGVYNASGNTFSIKTGNMLYNKVTNTNGKGGAVWVYDGSKFEIEGTNISMTPTSGYSGKSRYNDVFTPNTRALTLTSPTTTTFNGRVNITLSSNANLSYEVVGEHYTAPQPKLPANTFVLTDGSQYYSTKKIGDYGKLENK